MKIVTLFIGIFLIFILSSSVDNYAQEFLIQQKSSHIEQDIFYKVFGEFRDYLSWMSYLNADIVFHGGVYCKKCSTKHFSAEEALHHAEGEAHAHEHLGDDEKARHREKPSSNILLNIDKAIRLTEHRHLHGNEEKELLPWLYYATRLNPRNKKAYALGGYWVGIRLKKPREAIQFLLDGLVNNPDSWEINETIGEVYLLAEKDCKKAITYLEKAKQLGDGQNVDKFEKRKIYTFLAKAYIETGNPKKADMLYKELRNYFPEETIPDLH